MGIRTQPRCPSWSPPQRAAGAVDAPASGTGPLFGDSTVPRGREIAPQQLSVSVRFERDVPPLIDGLFAAALGMTRHRQDAEDLLQETLVRALRGFESYHDGTNIRAWLHRILLNTWITQYRKAQRRPSTHAVDESAFDHYRAGRIPTPIGLRAADVEVLEALPDTDIQDALAALKPEFRMAVYYADVEGLPYQQIAYIMRTPIGTVMSRLHRARRQLRRQLAYLVDQRKQSTPSVATC